MTKKQLKKENEDLKREIYRMIRFPKSPDVILGIAVREVMYSNTEVCLKSSRIKRPDCGEGLLAYIDKQTK